MSFMQPDARHLRMFHVEDTLGQTHLVPVDLVGDDWELADLQEYVPNAIALDDDGEPEAPWMEGWYVRLSAPGYLDCTDWDGPYGSEAEALDALAELHDICRHCWEQCFHDGDGCEASIEASKPTRFTMGINLRNAAFGETWMDRSSELRRILKQVESQLKQGALTDAGQTYVITDHNGNTIGHATLSQETCDE